MAWDLQLVSGKDFAWVKLLDEMTLDPTLELLWAIELELVRVLWLEKQRVSVLGVAMELRLGTPMDRKSV